MHFVRCTTLGMNGILKNERRKACTSFVAPPLELRESRRALRTLHHLDERGSGLNRIDRYHTLFGGTLIILKIGGEND